MEGGDAESAPETGSVALCLGCGHVMIYADGGRALRAPSDAELIELAGDPRIVGFMNVRSPEAYRDAHHRLKGLPDAPRRIAALRRDRRGYPVPWFVHWEGDEPDFRVIRRDGRERALKAEVCWICGQKLGRHRVFVIGPMCMVNRVTLEPPCHRECAEYAAIACPFLARPAMRRLPRGEEEGFRVAGVMIERNPGVTCLYEAKTARPFRSGPETDDWLIRLGDPRRVDFWREGRPATRAEVWASIESGLPILQDLARKEEVEEPGCGAVAELKALLDKAMRLLPVEEGS